MQFLSIPGQAKEKKQLVTQVNQDRIPHAQILLGRPGSPKLALALAYACYILCQDRKDGDACGVCKSCLKSMQYKHPDLHFAFPVISKEGKKREDTTSKDFLDQWRPAVSENPYLDIQAWSQYIGAEKTQPNINTRECNEMIKQLGMRSFESPYKLLLIWLPEYLGKEGNRLLKMIEEPTDNTFIILIAENQERILNTIISRCQITKVSPVSDVQATEYIKARHSNIDSEILAQAVQMSDGDLNKSLHIALGSSIDYSDLLLSWMRLSYKRDFSELNDWITMLNTKGREDIKHFIEYAMSFMREYAFYLQTEDVSRLSDSQQLIAENMTKIMDMIKVESVAKLLQECLSEIMRNINPRICLMAKSIELGDILRSKDQVKSLYDM